MKLTSSFGWFLDELSFARSDGPEITASMILIGQFFGGDGAWSPRVITCFGRTFFDVALTRDRWLHHWVRTSSFLVLNYHNFLSLPISFV